MLQRVLIFVCALTFVVGCEPTGHRQPDAAQPHDVWERPHQRLPSPRREPFVRYGHDPATGAVRIAPDTRYDLGLEMAVVALWRLDHGNMTWERVWPQRPGEAWKPIHARTSEVPNLDDVLGLELPIGLYYIIAVVEEQTERSYIFNGPVLCNDVMLGPAPPGMVATCVPKQRSATAMFVPDPSRLEPPR